MADKLQRYVAQPRQEFVDKPRRQFVDEAATAALIPGGETTRGNELSLRAP